MEYKLSIKKDISDLSGIDFINSETVFKIRSGESKRQDFIVTNANIVAYTKQLAKVLTQILNLIAEIYSQPQNMSVIFPTEYNVSTLTDQINDIILIDNAGISDLFSREAKKQFVERNCESIPYEKYEAIIKEIDETPAKTNSLFGDLIQ